MIDKMINRLSPFIGKPIKFNTAKVYSPTIAEVEEVSELEYKINLILATFNKEKVLINLFGFSDEVFDELEHEDSFDVLTDNIVIANHISAALSFFLKDEVYFDTQNKEYILIRVENENEIFLNRDNYKEFVKLLLHLNGSESEEKKPLTFKSERAKKMFKELNKLRQKNDEKKDDGLELKDILSLICNEEGNGIDVFNVHHLTIYQVYEHFERLGLKHRRSTILPVWANGHLKEGDKLPELITKTKL